MLRYFSAVFACVSERPHVLGRIKRAAREGSWSFRLGFGTCGRARTENKLGFRILKICWLGGKWRSIIEVVRA